MVLIVGPGDLDKVVLAVKSDPRTQRDIARAAGISDTTLSSYMSRVRKPSAGSLVKLARALDIPVQDLL